MKKEEAKQRAKAGEHREVSAHYKAEPEDLKLYSKITSLSDERVERLKEERW